MSKNDINDILDSVKSEIQEEIIKYIELENPLQLKQFLEKKLDDILELKPHLPKKLITPYMNICSDLATYCLQINELALANSIYQKLIPGFIPAFLEAEDIENKEEQWRFYPYLIINYFIIQHGTNGLKEEIIPSYIDMLKLKFLHEDRIYDMDTNKSSFVAMLIETHSFWKDNVTQIEEEDIWICILDWVSDDFLIGHRYNDSRYDSFKIFYENYRKTKRLDSLAYKVIEFLVDTFGVFESKKNLSFLLEKKAKLIKQLNKSFCKKYGVQLSNILDNLLMNWNPSEVIADKQIFEKLITNINSASYKRDTFIKCLIDSLNIESCFINKAYSLIALTYYNGLISKEEIQLYRFELAYSLNHVKEHQLAKKFYEELVEIGQASGSVLNNVAVIYRDIDRDNDKALQYFEEAVKKEPEEALFKRNVETTLEMIKNEKERPKRQLENYFKKTDKQLKSICFTIYKLEDLEKVTTEDIEKTTSFKGSYLKKHLMTLETLELIYNDPKKGWKLEPPIYEKVVNYVDPKLERQIIRNNQAVMYRPIFYHETEITLYRVLTELFPQHFVFPNMDLKTIIQVEKIRDYLEQDLLDYLFRAHVDFAIIDTTTYFPILTFERDSEFQDIEPQKTNAVKKNLIFQTSGLPLIRIRYNSAMDYERLKEEIKHATKEFILEISKDTDSETRRILNSIDPKKFGVYQETPSEEELKTAWEALVGVTISEYTETVELDTEQCVMKVTINKNAKPVVELAAETIKSKLYQKYAILNSIQFYWS